MVFIDWRTSLLLAGPPVVQPRYKFVHTGLERLRTTEVRSCGRLRKVEVRSSGSSNKKPFPDQRPRMTTRRQNQNRPRPGRTQHQDHQPHRTTNHPETQQGKPGKDRPPQKSKPTRETRKGCGGQEEDSTKKRTESPQSGFCTFFIPFTLFTHTHTHTHTHTPRSVGKKMFSACRRDAKDQDRAKNKTPRKAWRFFPNTLSCEVPSNLCSILLFFLAPQPGQANWVIIINSITHLVFSPIFGTHPMRYAWYGIPRGIRMAGATNRTPPKIHPSLV